MILLIKNFLKKLILFPTSPFVTKLLGETFIYGGKEIKLNRHNLSKVKKVLIIRFDNIGDMVMTTPFLRELRRNLFNARITLVVLPNVLNIVANCPYVNEIITCDWNGARDLHRFKRHWKSWRFAKKYLQNQNFDLAILPRKDADQSHGAILAYFSGTPKRVGYSDNNFIQNLPYYRNNDCLFTHLLKTGSLRHEVESNLDIIRYLGGDIQNDLPEIWLNPLDKIYAEHVLISYKIQPHELTVAIGPGATHPKRRWPIDRFVLLGNYLKSEYNATIIVIGGQRDVLLGQEIQQRIDGKVVNIVGKTSLRQTAAVLKNCNLFVGNDSGPMHIASAVGVPVIGISAHSMNGSSYHANSPKRFRPWSVPHRILQPDKVETTCFEGCTSETAHCILCLTFDEVKEAADELLSQLGRWIIDNKQGT